MAAIGEDLSQFPGAGQIQPNDLFYISQNGIDVAATAQQVQAAMATNAAREVFVAGTNFIAGTTPSLTLAGTYGSINNILVLADATIQTDCTLSGRTLGFNPVVPAGTQQITIFGGSARTIGVPASSSVGDTQLAWGSILARVCDSIAALAALNPAIYTRAFAMGYYAAGDGGGGPYTYSVSTLQTAANGGTIIAASGGVGCWILQHTGPVSVKQFGAKGDGVHDDAPPIQACITACADTWIADGTYLFDSTNPAPIPVTAPINVLIQSKSFFSVRCSSSAVFVCSNTANLSCMFGFWKCQNFVFDSPTLQGNRTGIPSTSETVGINLMSVVNFRIDNVHLIGNWGDSGTGFGGDWWANGLIRNVTMDQIGQGLDIAFLQNVTFENFNIFGHSIVTGGAGNLGLNTSYDGPLVGFNFTGIDFVDGVTNHVYFKGFKVQNMNAGFSIPTGKFYYFDDECNFNNNSGTVTGGIQGWGGIIQYFPSGPFSSVGHPPSHIYFQGTKFENNGLAVNGGGLLITGDAITNGDVISDIALDGCVFFNNGVSGLVTTGGGNLARITSDDGKFTSGGSQANSIVGSVINSMNSNGLPNNARLMNNFGFNPFGYFTPALPAGTGTGNTVFNTYAFPIDILISTNSTAYNPNIVQPSGAGTVNLGTVAAGSSPQGYTIPPGGGIFFNTNVPTAWEWYGH